MFKTKKLIFGTLILTLTSFFNRFIGFFYRIFLSRTFGEASVGLYQLLFPLLTLGYAVAFSGIEVALSRIIAQKISNNEINEAQHSFHTGLIISFTISCFITILVQKNASWIAEFLLHEQRCTVLLTLLSYIFPLASIHSCICGYYLGIKETKYIAYSQLIEQSTKVLFVFLICSFSKYKTCPHSISIAVVGLLVGEFFSCIYSVITIQKEIHIFSFNPQITNCFLQAMRELTSISLPITTNRVLLTLLQSIESISIPNCLVLYGLSHAQSLGLYGIFAGMAMPCILLPAAFTTSLSSLLLPTVAEIQSANKKSTLLQLIKTTITCTFILGCVSMIFFLLFGNFIGSFLFHNPTAGSFIQTLSWICPFLYTNTTLLSILNGLGYSSHSLFINICGICIRIISVFFFIPIYGILGYLWGLLIAQFIISVLSFFALKKIVSVHTI